MNPWNTVPASDYETHMAHQSVMQLQALNALYKKRISLYHPTTIAVIGACTGNGFEHFSAGTKKIYAVDINPEYLQICIQRYSSLLPGLITLWKNFGEEPLGIANIELIIADLVFEYVDLQKGIGAVKEMIAKDGILSITIQDSHGESSVSKTGIESVQVVSSIFKDVTYNDITSQLNHFGFTVIREERCVLPNKKELITVDAKYAGNER
jgi:hypothetical protein